MKWLESTLGEICDLQMGGTPSRKNKNYWDRDKKTNNTWLSISDLLNTDAGVINDSREYLSDEGAKKVKIVKKGTLLMSFKLTLGRLAVAGKDLRTNEAIMALPIKSNIHLEIGYLKYVLESIDWEKMTEGGRKVKGVTLNKDKIAKIKIRYPDSKEEQVKVISELSDAISLIDEAKIRTLKIVDSYDDLKRSLIQKAITG